MANKAFKGISPLVATIMLIAFTLIIAGIISAFVVNFTETQQVNIKSCVDAKVLLQRASFVPNALGDQGTLRFTIYNYGKVDLRFQAILTYPDVTNRESVQIADGRFDVKANSISSFSIANIDNDLDTLTIKSTKCDRPCTECPGAQDFLRYSDISGLT